MQNGKFRMWNEIPQYGIRIPTFPRTEVNPMSPALPNFLPGRFVLSSGTSRDYLKLQQFHYLPKRPATWAGVWTIRYFERDRLAIPRVVGVGVLSYPTLSCRPRERVLGI